MKHVIATAAPTPVIGDDSEGGDVGEEKRCSTCGEFWPADREFFFASKSRCSQLMSSCIACTVERRRRRDYSDRYDPQRIRPVASELAKAYVRRAAEMAKNK